jgi:DNA-binding IclR family transcriptional regulator
MSVTELAVAMELHPSTVSRLLGALQAYGFVLQDPNSQLFQVGPRCFQLGQVFVSQVEVATVAEPFMHSLTAEIGHPTHLGVLREGRVVRVKHVEPEGYVLRMSAAERYALGEVYCEALGKVLLAFQPDEEVERILDSTVFHKHTSTTITSKKGMLREVEAIRQQGYAVDNSERFHNVRCVAVPIWDHTGGIAAALSASGSDREMKAPRIKQLSVTMRKVSGAISQRLGASPPPVSDSAAEAL